MLRLRRSDSPITTGEARLRWPPTQAAIDTVTKAVTVSTSDPSAPCQLTWHTTVHYLHLQGARSPSSGFRGVGRSTPQLAAWGRRDDIRPL